WIFATSGNRLRPSLRGDNKRTPQKSKRGFELRNSSAFTATTRGRKGDRKPGVPGEFFQRGQRRHLSISPRIYAIREVRIPVRKCQAIQIMMTLHCKLSSRTSETSVERRRLDPPAHEDFLGIRCSAFLRVRPAQQFDGLQFQLSVCSPHLDDGFHIRGEQRDVESDEFPSGAYHFLCQHYLLGADNHDSLRVGRSAIASGIVTRCRDFPRGK